MAYPLMALEDVTSLKTAPRSPLLLIVLVTAVVATLVATAPKARVVVLEAFVDFLDLTPVDVTSLLGILDPSQLRIGLDHCVDALAYALLIDLFHI
ncbi:hypothetical protein A246_28366, partial [Pseudomonas syringae pv. actinidiae ICMP 19098]